MTVKEALGITDPLQNNFVSNHTKHDHDKRAQQKLDALHVEHQKENIPTAAFAGPERSELFDLDKITREHEFDKAHTESTIFTRNSQYWLRDNIGFSMKQSLQHSNRTHTKKEGTNTMKPNNSVNALKTIQKTTSRLPKISQKPIKSSHHRNGINGMNARSPSNHHINGHTISAPAGLSMDHRPLVGSRSLNKLYKELEFKSLSSILSSKKTGICSNFPMEPLTALSTSPCNSTSRSVPTGESTAMQSPLLDIKLHPRTPINHKQLKKYLYKNIFDKSRPNNKIYVLGSNSIQGPPPVTPLTS